MKGWCVLVLLSACAGGADDSVVEVPGTPAEPVLVSAPDTFTRWERGAGVVAAVDALALRDGPTVALGTPLAIVEALGEPVEVEGRRNVWYRVATPDGRHGEVFGADVTPLHGLQAIEGVEQPWAVSFGPDDAPRLVLGEPGYAGVLDLRITERFLGGRLRVRVEPWGESAVQWVVEQCPLDAEPTCAVAHVRTGGPLGIRQATPPDVERFAPPPLPEASCDGLEPVVLDEIEVETVLELELPPPAWGPGGPAPCRAVAVVEEGEHTGRRVLSCAVDVPGEPGPDRLEVLRYLEGEDSWTFLPCASDLGHAGEVHAALAEKQVRVSVDPTLALGAPLATPAQVRDGELTATLAWRTPHEVDRELMLRVFKDEAAGWVYRTKVLAFEDPEASRSPLVRGALALVQPDGGAVLYHWKPGATQVDWSSKAPGHELGYVAETLDCTGAPWWFLNLTPDIGRPDIRRVGDLRDGTPVFVLRDQRHPLQMEWLLAYRRLNEDPAWQPPAGVARTVESDEMLDSRPWLFLLDPWGRMVRLVREDLVRTMPCD